MIKQISDGVKIPRAFTIAFMIVSFIGFLDATYLTAQHYLGSFPPCVITTGCETVLVSEQSVIFGIPTALLGAGYYLIIFLLTIIALELRQGKIFHFVAFLTPIGFLASLYFVYLQLFVLKEICFYCMVSAATSTILFALGLFVIIKSRLMEPDLIKR